MLTILAMAFLSMQKHSFSISQFADLFVVAPVYNLVTVWFTVQPIMKSSIHSYKAMAEKYTAELVCFLASPDTKPWH